MSQANASPADLSDLETPVEPQLTLNPKPEELPEESDSDPQGPDFTQLQDQLTRVNQTSAETQSALAQLLSDPQLREAVQKRAAGEDLFSPEPAPSSKPDPADEAPPDFSEMTQAETVNYLLSKVDSMMAERIVEAQKPTNEMIQNLAQLWKSDKQADYARELDSLAKTYPDIRQWAPDMQEVSKSNPGLGLEELYQIARLRKGARIADPNSIETERPNNPPASTRPKQKKEYQGNQGFENLISGVLDRIEINTEL